MMIRKWPLIFLMLAVSLFITPTFAQQDIRIGMSTALSGPAQALGQGMLQGVQVYFDKVNAEGGINGQKLQLLALDDGYEPSQTAPNMRKLIDEEKVLAVIGNVGTPTAIVAVPIANQKQTLLFGAFTGAGVLRKNPPDRYIINLRASYAQETAAMVNGLIKAGIKADELAFFTQNDGYGDAGYAGAMQALKQIGYNQAEQLPHGRYTRNTLNVEDGLAKILDADTEPRAIIMVGAYAPNAKFIRLAKQDFPDAHFLNVSFVGSVALSKALGKQQGEGVIITQVVPHFQADLPAVKEYWQALKKYAPHTEPDFVSLEGYLAAKVFVAGVRKAAQQGPLTRENLVIALESIHDLDVGIGISINYSKSKHQALDVVWPTILKNGVFVPLDWSSLK